MTTRIVIDWLLDSDPSIRWQVMRDLLHEPADQVANERSRVASEGWGSRLLDLQAPDGHWGGGAYIFPDWLSTTDTLLLLRDLGLDPASERTRRAIGLVRENSTWGPEFGDSPFFEGEVEPCINGRVLASGAYFGEGSDRLVDRLLNEQLEDGGWNCEAPRSKRSSFHTTICVLEGLLEYEKAKGATTALREARFRGQEYLLDRRLFRSLSTGEVIDNHWTQFSFPTRWHYDILWGLDFMRRAGVEPDARVAEAIDLAVKKRDANGRWLLENPHAGEVHFDLEDGAGLPSRWNTLRALRVLDWYTNRG
ncbi:MAG: hypothetical protein J2P41_10140 [Blastocatellia bacterium]|nr:hypothetical protein [Blastocatellia bacterium]